jgi:hypothetical protein
VLTQCLVHLFVTNIGIDSLCHNLEDSYPCECGMTDQYLKVAVCWHAVGEVSFSVLLSDGVAKQISCLLVDVFFLSGSLQKGGMVERLNFHLPELIGGYCKLL